MIGNILNGSSDVKGVLAMIDEVTRRIEAASGDTLVNTLTKQINSLLGSVPAAAPAPKVEEPPAPVEAPKPTSQKTARRTAYDTIDGLIDLVRANPKLSANRALYTTDAAVQYTAFRVGDLMFGTMDWDLATGEKAVANLKALKRALR
jgi:hypothetical protein